MRRRFGATAAILAGLALACSLAPALADHDDKGKRERGKGGHDAAAPLDQTYERECGACHWAYFPGLLPARSWDKLLTDPAVHFGESLTISPGDLETVRRHLRANAADKSSQKRPRKIMKSIGGATPTRITELAYLRDKHRKLDPEVLRRPAVGGLGNCLACHPGAKSGDYDDDNVAIPR